MQRGWIYRAIIKRRALQVAQQDRTKYFIFIGELEEENKYLCFFINSKNYYRSESNLATCKIEKQHYPFMANDVSYADVHRPVELLASDMRGVKALGELMDTTKLAIKRITQGSLDPSSFNQVLINSM